MSGTESHGESRWDEAMAAYWRRQESGDFDEHAFLGEFSDIRKELVEFLEHRSKVVPHLSGPMTPIPSATPPPPSFPREFGNYTLQRELGRGGMGVVYEAIQKNPRRTVAVKMILDSQLASSTDIERFQKEAQTAAELHHSNIVTIFEIGVYKRQHYFSMEYVSGETLSQKVRQTALTPEKAARYLKKVAETISFAHAKGVLHRDLTPSNILIDDQEQPKISDFGLTKRIDDPQQLTMTGKFLGKPNYVSPEQADGKQLGPTSDVYSLGAVLYELLTGRPPFQGESIKDTLWMASHSEPVAPRRLNPKIPKDIETICLHCLEKQPQKRYQSAQELTDDLGRYLRNEPISARPVGAAERAWRWCQRNPAITSLLIAVVLTASIGAGGVLWQWGTATQALADMRAAQSERIAAQVEALLTAEPEEVPAILAELGQFRSEVMAKLRQVEQRRDLSPRQQGRVALGLLAADPHKSKFLVERMMECPPREHLLIRKMLIPYGDDLRAQLWSCLENSEVPERRFRAACALAAFDSDDERWKEFCDEVAAGLIGKGPSEATLWLEALWPVHHILIGSLARIYHSDTVAGDKTTAAIILAKFASDRPGALIDLIENADLAQYSVLLPQIKAHKETMAEILHDRLFGKGQREKPATGKEVERPLDSQDAADDLAKHQTRMAITLLHLETEQRVWELLRHTADPRVRTYLIHEMPRLGLPPELLIDRLTSERDESARRALVLSLGEYSAHSIPEALKNSLVQKLVVAYAAEPDPGIHSAIEWLLRRWGIVDQLEATDNRLARSSVLREQISDDRKWYLNSQKTTMSIIPGPTEFLMGSAPKELRAAAVSAQGSDDRQVRRIPRTFAIATKEVTLEQFQEFRKDHPFTGHWYSDVIIRDHASPVTNVTWHEAALYCRWLSKQEQIPEDQMCYKPPSQDATCEPYPDYLNRTGYRLPTNAEWEYACRSGTDTARFYGHDLQLMAVYGWTLETCQSHVWPAGTLKPNDFGLFDVYGTAQEWCHDFSIPQRRYFDAFLMSTGIPFVDGDTPLREEIDYALRGGGFDRPQFEHRSAAVKAGVTPDLRDNSLGFRVCRTLKTHAITLDTTLLTQANAGNAEPQLLDSSRLKTIGVVSLASTGELAPKLDYVFGLIGRPGYTSSFTQLVHSATKADEFATHRTGAFIQSDGLRLLPIVFSCGQVQSETEALFLASAFYPVQERLDNDIYRLSDEPPYWFMRYADGYIYGAFTRAQLEGHLPDPTQAVDAIAAEYDCAVSVRLNDLTRAYSDIITAAGLWGLAGEGRDLTVGLKILPEKKTAVIDVILRANQGSPLSHLFVRLASAPSRFANLRRNDGSLRFGLTLLTDEWLQRPMLTGLEQIERQVIAEAVKNDAAATARNKTAIADLFSVIRSTVKSGKIDVSIVSSQITPTRQSLTGAVHVPEVEPLETLFLREVSEAALPPGVSLDKSRHREWRVYTLKPKPDFLSALFLGVSPVEYYAFGDDAAVFSVGAGNMTNFERVLDGISAPTNGNDVAPLDFQLDWGKYLPTLGSISDPDLARTLRIARESLAQDDHIGVTIYGIADGVVIRLELEEGVLKGHSKAILSGFERGYRKATSGDHDDSK